MAFWKKRSDDPWDCDPEKNKPAADKTVPSWVREKPVPAPMTCPWCGGEMLGGTLYGGMQRGGYAAMSWQEGPHRSFLESLGAKEGAYLELGSWEDAWYCTACKKMTLDVDLALKSHGPNYVWKDGKVVFPDEETEE